MIKSDIWLQYNVYGLENVPKINFLKRGSSLPSIVKAPLTQRRLNHWKLLSICFLHLVYIHVWHFQIATPQSKGITFLILFEGSYCGKLCPHPRFCIMCEIGFCLMCWKLACVWGPTFSQSTLLNTISKRLVQGHMPLTEYKKEL